MMGALELCAQEILLKGKSSRSEHLIRPSGQSAGLQNAISVLSVVSLEFAEKESSVLFLVTAWKADIFNLSYVDELQFTMLKINMKNCFVIIGILVGYIFSVPLHLFF